MKHDIAVIGGGIVGLATALGLTSRSRLSLIVLEAEDRLAAHQTGHNSGVIHSGLYYKPGSLKARNCVEGREALYRFCQEHDIAHDRCGKVVVATRTRELSALDQLERRGQANGLTGLRRLKAEEIRDPVPDPRFPFLGVHFTRMIHGGVEAGPNAVLAFKRDGYRRSSFSARDVAEMIAYGGFWRMASKFWRTGIGEFYRSFSQRAFVKGLQRLIPDLSVGDVRRAGAGVRAQALEPNGLLVDDFRIVEVDKMIHVLNAPSPAATASISIGQAIAAMAVRNFDLRPALSAHPKSRAASPCRQPPMPHSPA